MKPVIKKGLEQVGVEVGKSLIGLFVDWVKTRPLKTAIARRRAAKKAGK